MRNTSLHQAKKAKNDEFYTQYADIEKEMNAYLEYNPDVFRGKVILLPCDDPEWSNFTKYFAQNFETFGIKKLISTSYAASSKPDGIPYQPTLFEMNDPKFDEKKTRSRGKIFVLECDKNKDKKINIDDLEWSYLEGDGDFRSVEVTKLRDEADIVITNPPFSLFRDFMAWVIEANKKFCIIGNLNAATYKDTFSHLKKNELWMGSSYFHGGAAYFIADPALYEPEKMSSSKHAYMKDGLFYWRVNGVRWYTNLDHGRRHQPIPLMTMADNLKYSKHKSIQEHGYPKYDNYDAIEVPYTDAIPSDYPDAIGVPISFLDKFCPEQFAIIGCSDNGIVPDKYKLPHFKRHNEPYVNGEKVYKRLFIKHKEAA